jgi:hypothetical protein
MKRQPPLERPKSPVREETKRPPSVEKPKSPLRAKGESILDQAPAVTRASERKVPIPDRASGAKIDRKSYDPEPIPDQAPSFWRKPKDEKSPRVTIEEPPSRKGGKQTKSSEQKSNGEQRLFFDPPETASSKLRNQTIRQKLAIVNERMRIEEEEEHERESHRRAAGRRVEPELRRLAAVSRERQKHGGRGRRAENDESVKELRTRLQKVEAADVMLRRNDRSMILADVGNKHRKEERAMRSKAETEKLEKRRVAHERVAQLMKE